MTSAKGIRITIVAIVVLQTYFRPVPAAVKRASQPEISPDMSADVRGRLT
jgi:hypothetical protein